VPTGLREINDAHRAYTFDLFQLDGKQLDYLPIEGATNLHHCPVPYLLSHFDFTNLPTRTTGASPLSVSGAHGLNSESDLPPDLRLSTMPEERPGNRVCIPL
jgi:hypothetical protein